MEIVDPNNANPRPDAATVGSDITGQPPNSLGMAEVLGIPSSADRVRAVFERYALTSDLVASNVGILKQDVEAVLDGHGRMTPSLAFALSRATGTSAAYWLTIDAQERAGFVPTTVEFSPQNPAITAALYTTLSDRQASQPDRIAAAISVGELNERNPRCEKALIETALETSNRQLFRACVEALAGQDLRAARVLTEASFERGNSDITIEALHLLYGLEPGASVRRAYEILQESEPATSLADEAKKCILKYFRHFSASGDADTQDFDERLGGIKDEIRQTITSGNGNYHIVQPSGYVFRDIGSALFVFYRADTPDQQSSALNMIRKQDPAVAELVALSGVESPDATLRAQSLVTLKFVKSSLLLEWASHLSADPVPAVASLAKKIAGALP